MGEKKIDVRIQGVDSAYGLDLCDGDFDIYLSSLRLFISSIPETLEKLRGVNEETLKDYTVIVHGIKGMSEYIGALKAKETAKMLEGFSKEGNLQSIKMQNDSFINSVNNLVNNVRVWLEKYDANNAA